MQASNAVIQSSLNQYRGPNAHLLSLQQTPRPNVSLWKSFHSDYITYISAALNLRLPPGYVAVTDQSLLIQLEPFEGDATLLPPRYPDSTVYISSIISPEMVNIPE